MPSNMREINEIGGHSVIWITPMLEYKSSLHGDCLRISDGRYRTRVVHMTILENGYPSVRECIPDDNIRLLTSNEFRKYYSNIEVGLIDDSVNELLSKYTGEHIVFQPKHMTPEELKINTLDLDRKWHKTPMSIERILRGMNLGLYPFAEILGIEIFWRLINLRFQRALI